jgi:hypothetical protein
LIDEDDLLLDASGAASDTTPLVWPGAGPARSPASRSSLLAAFASPASVFGRASRPTWHGLIERIDERLRDPARGQRGSACRCAAHVRPGGGRRLPDHLL